MTSKPTTGYQACVQVVPVDVHNHHEPFADNGYKYMPIPTHFSESVDVYISTHRAKVYHETKGHYNADIPITDTTGLLLCSRCAIDGNEKQTR